MQISCSDMVERFQLSIYIFFVVLQYMKVRATARARARARARVR